MSDKVVKEEENMVIRVKFLKQNGGVRPKSFRFNTTIEDFKKGDFALVETERGQQVGKFIAYGAEGYEKEITKSAIKKMDHQEYQLYKEQQKVDEKKEFFKLYDFNIDEFTGINYDVPLENHCNALIRARVLEDDKMREIGFTDYKEDTWYFCNRLKEINDISFSISIKKDGTEFRIDVLDENYLQPYNYQRMLKEDPKFLYGLITHVQVQGWMKYLQDNGVISGYIANDYI